LAYQGKDRKVTGKIIINWYRPMPDPVPGMRDDPGGYIYQIFRDDGRKVIGGSSHSDLEKTTARAIRLAAEKGIVDPEIIIREDWKK
jgi:hypothetical protein